MSENEKLVERLRDAAKHSDPLWESARDRLDLEAATALTLAQARIKVLEADKDAAFGFISDLVNMQSGQGWSRSVVREAAANFLYGRGAKIPHGPDKTPDVIALALKEASDD